MTLDRWQILGYVLAFLSPVWGFIVGMLLYTDKKVKDHNETGKYVIILSVIMTLAYGLIVWRTGLL